MTTFLTTGQVANYCHVTYWTVIKWIKAGKLKAYKSPGEHNRIAKEDFIQFLNEYDLPIPLELDENSRKRLLIVDDDVTIINLLKELLEDIENLDIETASNGYEAGIRMATFKPHIMILDLWMPNINGFEVCKHVKYNPETSNIKILAITGYPCDQSIEKISDIGADVFLEKPLDAPYVKSIIEKMIKGEEICRPQEV